MTDKDENLRLPRLKDGSGFDKWQSSIKLALRAQGLWKLVSGASADDAKVGLLDVELNEAQEAKALHLIYTSLSDEIKPTLSDDITAAKLWKQLVNTYGKRTFADVILLGRRLNERRKQPNETMAKFLSDVTDLYNEINNSRKGYISDNAFRGAILTGVPDDYSCVTIPLANSETSTVAQIKAQLLNAAATLEANRQVTGGSSVRDTAYHARTQSQSDGRPYCTFCKRAGHLEEKCFKKPENAHLRPSRQRANTTQERAKHQAHLAASALEPLPGPSHGGESAHLAVERAFMARETTKPPPKKATKVQQQSDEDIELLVDSAASRHMLRDEDVFSGLSGTASCIQTCQEGTTIPVKGSGTAELCMGTSEVKLQHAFLVPDLEANLLSLGRIQRSGGAFRSCGNDKMMITIQGATIVATLTEDGLYHVRASKGQGSSTAVAMHAKDVNHRDATRWSNWHVRFGHAGPQAMRETLKHYGVDIKPVDLQCKSCILGKSTKLPFDSRPADEWATVPLGRVHSDICGPFPVQALDVTALYFAVKALRSLRLTAILVFGIRGSILWLDRGKAMYRREEDRSDG